MLIIPAIDLLNGQCVRLNQGDYSHINQYSSDPIAVAKQFKNDGAKHLHIIDLDGAKAGTPINWQTIIKIYQATKLSIQVGGGIRSYQDAAMYLNAGIEKVIFGTSAINNIDAIKTTIANFGATRVIAALDIKNSAIAIHGWQQQAAVSVAEFISTLKAMDISTVIVTDTSKDGMLSGPNFQLMNEMKQYNLNLIAAGGMHEVADLVALKKLGIAGAIVGKAVYENKINLAEAIKQLSTTNELAKRIIPCLDIKNNSVVKGTHFKNLTTVGDPIALGKFYSEQGADELVFLDITATNESRKNQTGLAANVAAQINIPFTIGGGIHSLQDINDLLMAGADKVAIGTAAVNKPDLIEQAALQFGSQCIVISLDVKKHQDNWLVYTHGGSNRTTINALSFAKTLEGLGAGELLINSLDRDGTQQGYDLELLASINNAVTIPVIASSGAGTKTDFLKAFSQANVAAVLAASVFHSQTIRINDLKQYLSQQHVKVRL